MKKIVRKRKPANGMSPETVVMFLGFSELKLYMTRGALRHLASRLVEISDAPAEECFEVHVGLEAMRMDRAGNVKYLPLKSSDGVAKLFNEMHEDAVKAEEGENSIWEASPFELTFMHVSRKVVQETASWPEDQETASWPEES